MHGSRDQLRQGSRPRPLQQALESPNTDGHGCGDDVLRLNADVHSGAWLQLMINGL
jgi:hypothetical protein